MASLFIKQRVVAFTDTYDVYSSQDQPKYFVKAEAFRLSHHIHFYDASGEEVAYIEQALLTLTPRFRIYIHNSYQGEIIRRILPFLSNHYSFPSWNWSLEGDIFNWDYQITQDNQNIAFIHRKLISWGDAYALDIEKDENELPVLVLAIAIDAANCR